MRTKKKIALTALSAILVGSLVSGTALMALAHEDTYGYEFDARKDVLWEDFNWETVPSYVNASDNGADLGDKTYLHVEYSSPLTNKEAPILKQGINVAEHGTKAFVIEMRSPDSSVKLSDLYLALRHNDDDILTEIPFQEIFDGEEEISTEWHKYILGFENNAYLDEHDYPSGAATSNGEMLGFHIYSSSTAEGAGKLDINQVYYNLKDEDDIDTSGREMINIFIGGDDADATGKATNSGTWWADSMGGTLEKRDVNLTTGGELSLVKDDAVGNYSYAIIEAEGDVEGLKVATTTDGTTWGTPVAYDGTEDHAGSIVLTGEEKGFKFTYEGTGKVHFKRIYLSNLAAKIPTTEIPVIDASTVKVIEDFSVSQSTIAGDYAAAIAQKEAALAGVYYRLSYAHPEMVKISDGALTLDGTNLVIPKGDGAERISFKFQIKNANIGKYLVMKVKGDADALDRLSLNIGLGDGKQEVGSGDWKGGYGFDEVNKTLDNTNPYATDDGWYYVVINVEETWSKVDLAGGIDTFDFNYRGEGKKLEIDSIFFAEEAKAVNPLGNSLILKDENDETKDFVLDYDGTAGDGYQYHGRTKGFDEAGKDYDGLVMDITVAEGTDFNSVRYEFAGGVKWAHELYLIDGSKLSDVQFTAGVKKSVVIDLVRSGVVLTDFHIHSNGTDTGAFKIENVKAVQFTAAGEVKKIEGYDEENGFVLKDENDVTKDFVLDYDGTGGETYQYHCRTKGFDDLTEDYAYLAMDVTVAEGTNFSTVRYEFVGGTKWAHELYLADGSKLSDVQFTAGVKQTVYIDLEASGVVLTDFHIHSGGISTGAFKIENVVALNNNYVTDDSVAAAYASQVEALENAIVDSVAPVVTIKTGTTAEAGDEITIDYDVEDNVSAVADIDVVVTVTDKDDKAVTVTGGKFTPTAAGTYTVTVTATDEAGNKTEQTLGIIVSEAAPADTTGPEVTITTANTAKTGDEITIAYTVSDNVSAKDKISVAVAVKDKDGNAVAVTSNKFTASAAGEYTVTVTATDEAGNKTEKTLKITVTDPAPSTDGEKKPDDGKKPDDEKKPDDGKKTNLTWLWVLLGIAGGCGIGVGVFFLVKHLKGKKGNQE